MNALRSYWLGAAALCSVLAVAACSGGTNVASPPLGNALAVRSNVRVPVEAKRHKRGTANVVIRIPRKKKSGRRMHPAYVSASTQSMVIANVGQANQTFNLTPSSSGCSSTGGTGYLTCSETAYFPSGQQILTITLYDQENGQGNQLSTATTLVNIATGGVTPIPITLDGVVATATVLLNGSAAVSQPAAMPTSIPISVEAYDADNNLIVSPGSYSSPITLADSDTSGGTSLSSSTIETPGTNATLQYTGASISSATITPVVGGTPLPGGAATLTVTAPQPAVAEYSIGNSTIGSDNSGISAGPDGAIWFFNGSASQIVRMTTGGSITNSYAVANGNGYQWGGITTGPDNALWFSQACLGAIDRMTTAGVATQYIVNGGNSAAVGMTTGPGNEIWFADCFGNAIGEISTNGVVNEFRVPVGVNPTGLAVGADGALWFTEPGDSAIGRMTTTGTFTQYFTPTTASKPLGITAGPDGALWFTEREGGQIGRITTGGTFTEYSLPIRNANPEQIVAGPDGALWFTQVNPASVDEITTAGVITQLTHTFLGTPEAITVGPDGNIWFNETSSFIGKIVINGSASTSLRHHTSIHRNKAKV
jgi:virginiamycin B lyase